MQEGKRWLSHPVAQRRKCINIAPRIKTATQALVPVSYIVRDIQIVRKRPVQVTPCPVAQRGRTAVHVLVFVSRLNELGEQPLFLLSMPPIPQHCPVHLLHAPVLPHFISSSVLLLLVRSWVGVVRGFKCLSGSETFMLSSLTAAVPQFLDRRILCMSRPRRTRTTSQPS